MRGDCPIRMKKLVNGCLLLFALGCGSPAAFAQWVTQTITLNPGWNAVYLEVQPANSDCDAVFAGIPVESVWAWNRRFSSVQFIQDANQLVPGQPDYRLNASGRWQLISSPATNALRAGEALWVYCLGASTFSGPVQLTLEQRDGLLYGRILTEQTLRIKNNSGSVRSLTVQELPSHIPTDTNSPVLAGAVPLSYYKIDAANHQFGWITLPSQLQKLNMQPGEEWVLRLEVKRQLMADFVPPPNHNGVHYQSILNLSDDTGIRYLISVSAEGVKTYASTASAVRQIGKADAGAPPDPRAGLWVGSAAIDKVSQPAGITSPANPVPVGSPFQFRLIVHVDNDGK